MIKKSLAALGGLALGASLLVGSGVASADPANVCKVKISEYGSNAPGKDTTANRNAEFIRLVNATGGSLDVEGWWVQDEYPHVFKLKGSALPAGSPFRSDGPDGISGNIDDRFVLPVGGQVYVYNGSGSDGNPTNLTAAIYRNEFHHFNNAGDTLSFHDTGGTTVAWVRYTPYRVRIGC